MNNSGRKLLIYLDTNCWYAGDCFLRALRQYRDDQVCDIGCTSSIAFECATAENIALSKIGLIRLLDLTNVWLRGPDEMFKGVIGHIRNGWTDQVEVRFLEHDQASEKACWKEKLSHIETTHATDRDLKLQSQIKF